MKVKGLSLAQLQKIAHKLGFKLDNVRQQGNFQLFTLRMATRTAEAPDAKYRKRGFSGRRGVAVCFHGHRRFYEEIFKYNHKALIVTCLRRWTSLQDLAEHAPELGRRNVGSAFDPQRADSQCDCSEPDMEPTVRVMKQSDLLACPFTILLPEHYRPDGSCKCDDEEHREMMIKEWEYSQEDFDNIPLRA